MFEVVNYNINLVAGPFENLKFRDRTVLFLCTDKNNQYLFGAKDFYPSGIVRMLGGGVEKGETVPEAALREIKEELNLTVDSKLLKPLIEVKVIGNFQKQFYKTSIFVYFLDLKDSPYQAGDDVKEIVKFDESEVKKLISKYQDLKDNDLFLNGENTFSWADYGKVYGFVLSSAIKKLKEIS